VSVVPIAILHVVARNAGTYRQDDRQDGSSESEREKKSYVFGFSFLYPHTQDRTILRQATVAGVYQ
jgi:hypothetical protein